MKKYIDLWQQVSDDRIGVEDGVYYPALNQTVEQNNGSIADCLTDHYIYSKEEEKMLFSDPDFLAGEYVKHDEEVDYFFFCEAIADGELDPTPLAG